MQEVMIQGLISKGIKVAVYCRVSSEYKKDGTNQNGRG